jgi:hypothetical protein
VENVIAVWPFFLPYALAIKSIAFEHTDFAAGSVVKKYQKK